MVVKEEVTNIVEVKTEDTEMKLSDNDPEWGITYTDEHISGEAEESDSLEEDPVFIHMDEGREEKHVGDKEIKESNYYDNEIIELRIRIAELETKYEITKINLEVAEEKNNSYKFKAKQQQERADALLQSLQKEKAEHEQLKSEHNKLIEQYKLQCRE